LITQNKKEKKMKSLQQIFKTNGQDPNKAYQAGQFKFDKTAGCQVYNPPKEKKIKSKPKARC
jgi:hypothetical protein